MAVEPAPDIERVVRDGHTAYQRGDADALKGGWSKDKSATLFGSAPGERWEGPTAITEGMAGDIAQRSDQAPRSRLENVHAYRDGDVGWAVAEIVTVVGDDEIPTRGNAVLRREDGEWKFVLWAYSVLVPNEVFEPGSTLVETVSTAR